MSKHMPYTPSPWHWNSYSQIFAVVPKGDHMDDSDDDSEHGYAVIGWAEQAPIFRGHGDELHDPETQGNAILLAAAPELFEAGKALASYLYATNNPGELPLTVREAMRVFERVEREQAHVKRTS